MKRSEVDEMVRRADPVDGATVRAWQALPATATITARIIEGRGQAVHRARSRSARGVRIAVATATGAALAGGGAATATVLLGRPAPPAVRRDLRGVDIGFPADLRFNPDVEHARSVAVSGSSTLYAATLKDGGRCTELVMGGVARGAVCRTAIEIASQPIDVTIPFTDPIASDSPVTLGGHVNVSGATGLLLRYGDGGTDPILLTRDGFFVFEVPAGRLASVHQVAFQLVATSAGGTELATTDIPAMEEESAPPPDDTAPITVDTISDSSDFTKVLGVRGVVNAKGAATLTFRYPDGQTVDVPLGAAGRYRLSIPQDRQRDLADAPGTLIARDADGHEIASVPVASVAFWRAHGG